MMPLLEQLTFIPLSNPGNRVNSHPIQVGIQMKPFSLNLDEESFAEIGRRFSVSGKVVGKFVRQKRELRTVAPQVHRRGRKPAV